MKLSFIVGTRPEAIKLCPVILAAKQRSEWLVDVCATAQHREMLDEVLGIFGIVPDTDLNLMNEAQTLSSLMSRAILGVDSYLASARPDLLLVQGDTTTVLSAAVAAFYRNVPVGHVEAGLRTWNLSEPFPEEMNRVLTSRLARLHFAPTEGARRNLLAEEVSPESIFVTGNTVIDALEAALEQIAHFPPHVPGIAEAEFEDKRRIVLITGHRRESFGEGIAAICDAVQTLASLFPDVTFVYPVHPNPNVRIPVFERLAETRNVRLLEPLPYLAFVRLMNAATLIISDSGGIQEEAPSLGKPLVVTRVTTERPEAVNSGWAQLVGTDPSRIVRLVSDMLNGVSPPTMGLGSPFGDGRASARIVDAIASWWAESHP